MAVVTVRMSDNLKEKAQKFSNLLGVPLNSLLVIALNDYLNMRSRYSRYTGSGEKEMTTFKSVAQEVEKPSFDEVSRPPYAGTPRNAPCPCGSGLKYKRCHGKGS